MEYSLELLKNDEVLDVLTEDIFISEIPYFGLDKSHIGSFIETEKIIPSLASLLDQKKSKITLFVGGDLSVILPKLWEDLQNTRKFSIEENLEFFLI